MLKTTDPRRLRGHTRTSTHSYMATARYRVAPGG